jgi:hypothetical protein
MCVCLPQTDREKWFIYRPPPHECGLEFVRKLTLSHPCATVLCADVPVAIGCSDAAIFKHDARTPVPSASSLSFGSFGEAAAPSKAEPSRNAVVYQAPYVFLGSACYGIGNDMSVKHVTGGLQCARQTSGGLLPPPNFIYVYPAIPHTDSMHGSQHPVSARTSALAQRFRVYLARSVTRLVGESGPGVAAVHHAVNFDGPCVARAYDDNCSVDQLLMMPEASAVVCVDLQLAPEMLPYVPSCGRPSDVSPLTCAWLTRRCPVDLVHLRPVGIAEACFHWQEWANTLVVNRLRWAYSVSIRSENPGDGASMWPTRHTRRASLLSEPSPGMFGSGESQGNWGAGRRASILRGAAQIPPKYRQLVRTDDGVKSVAAEGSVWLTLAKSFGMEELLHPGNSTDSLDSVDVGGGTGPLKLPVLHRRVASRIDGDGDGTDQKTARHVEFIVQDLGDDGIAAAAASGGVYDVDKIVLGSHAAEVLSAAVLDVSHPKFAFACGMRVIRVLLDDYR